MIRKFFLVKVLKRFTRRPAPNLIPLSSQRARDRNYYSVRLVARDQSFDMLVGKLEGDMVVGRILGEGGGYREEYIIPLSTAVDANFEVQYYLDKFEFSSSNPITFEIGSWIGYYWASVKFDALVQWAYNRKSLVLRERYDLLRYLVEKTIENPGIKFSPVIVMGKLHTNRVVWHPDFSSRHRYYHLLFDSLKEDLLLTKVDMQYVVAPRALSALNDYEEESRRHSNAIRLQLAIAFFGVVSAIATAIQAWPIWKKL